MKLVLIDGLPGIGKSTLAERLCGFAGSLGCEARWYREEDQEHPVHPAGLTKSRRLPGYSARCLQGWQRFAERYRSTNGLCILEGSLFQSTVRFMMEQEQGGIRGYLAEFESIVQSLSPVTIYLRSVDATDHSRSTALYRGAAWTTRVSAYLETTQYARRRNLNGAEGMHRLWTDYAELCDSLLDQMSMPKLTMLVEPPDMERPFGRSVDFLKSTGHIRAATKLS
ncbi:P-loop NTPase family protein [Cupriavidus sp. PET2-C1]